jgi:Zn-dependent M28 family amino/carboxypeptidase
MRAEFAGTPKFSIDEAGSKRDLTQGEDISVRASMDGEKAVALKNVPLVFCGYGVKAPERKWDDFKGVDVRGKTLVFLVNDPPLPDPNDPARLDEKMVKGKAMTYYGRWSYKYEIAAEKGAAAAIIVHETIPAAYPWSVVANSNAKTNFVIEARDRNMSTLGVRSWITLDTARKLFTAAGKN